LLLKFPLKSLPVQNYIVCPKDGWSDLYIHCDDTLIKSLQVVHPWHWWSSTSNCITCVYLSM